MIPSYFKIKIFAIQDEFVLSGRKGLICVVYRPLDGDDMYMCVSVYALYACFKRPFRLNFLFYFLELSFSIDLFIYTITSKINVTHKNA